MEVKYLREENEEKTSASGTTDFIRFAGLLLVL
jgi:hypothetical protein